MPRIHGIWFFCFILFSQTALALLSASPNPSTTGNTTVSWTSISGSTNYKLYESVGSGLNQVYYGLALSKSLTGLAIGDHVYKLYNCHDEWIDPEWPLQGYYQEICVPTLVIGWPNITVTINAGTPPVPGNITGPAKDVYDGSYTLSWGSSSGATKYQYRRKVGSGGWGSYVDVTPNSLPMTGENPGTYTYRVRACAGSSCSNETPDFVVAVENLNPYIPTPINIAGTGIAGSVAFNTWVSDKGDAHIEIPISAVPGINGLTPSLSLSYTSGGSSELAEQQKVEGVLGYGWSLKGISEIRRCLYGVSGWVTLNLTDRLCLNGEGLILNSGSSYWADNAVYRTETQSFVRVVARGTGVNNRWFEAYTADGHTLTFGNNDASRVTPSNNALPYIWSMTKQVDDFNNAMTVTYRENDLAGTNFPVTINYGSAKVEFFYEVRSDTEAVQMQVIVPGVVKRAVVLDHINIKMNNNMVRMYRIENTLVGGAYRVNRVQSCGYNEAGTSSKCMAPLSFAWQTGSTSIPNEVRNLVTNVTSSLGDVTKFIYEIIEGDDLLTFTTHARHWSTTDFTNTFGSYNQPTNVQTHPNQKRALVKDFRIPDGRSGTYRRFIYVYHGYPLYDVENRGYVGFPGLSIRQYNVPSYDSTTGANATVYGEKSTIEKKQKRLDLHLYGNTARKIRWLYNPEFNNWKYIGYSAQDWATKTLTNGAVFPYLRGRYDRNFELDGSGGQVPAGAAETKFTYCFRALSGSTCPTSGSELEYPTQLKTATQIGTNYSGFIGGTSVWGDNGYRTIYGKLDFKESEANYTNQTSSTKWSLGFVSKLTQRSGITTPIVADDVITNFTKNATFDNEIKTINRFAGDAIYDSTETRTLNGNGNLTNVSVSGGTITTRSSSSSSFASSRYPQTITNEEGHVLSATYDLRFGAPKTLTDPNGNMTTFVRDEFGRVISASSEDGTITTTAYDSCTSVSCSAVTWAVPRMRITTTTTNGATQLSPITRVYMDGVGHAVLRETEAFSTTDGWAREEFHYDELGRLTKESLPYYSNGGTPQYSAHYYGHKLRLVRTDRPDGSRITRDYLSMANGHFAVEVTHSENGTIGPFKTKRSEFNSARRVVKTIDAYTTADAVTTDYAYDHRGNLDAVTVDNDLVADMDYDIASNRTQIEEVSSGITGFVFNELGQLIQTTDAKSQKTLFAYDKLSRLTQRIDGYLGSGTITNTWVWDTAANGTGSLKSQTNGILTENFAYDGFGRLDISTSTISAPSNPGNGTYTFNIDYDGAQRPYKVNYPGAIAITNAYNGRGYITQVKKGSTVLQEFKTRNALGAVTKETYGNGLQTIRRFDDQTGRLTAIETGTAATPKSIQDLEYQWKKNGNLFKRSDHLGSSTTSDDREETFTYDALNRLLTSTADLPSASNRTKSFAYDAHGNLQSKLSNRTGDLDVTGYNYSLTGQPHRLNSATVDGVFVSFLYDSAGNVTEYAANSGDGTFISYDTANRAIKITLGTSSTASSPTARDEFWYGPNGERVARKATWADGGQQTSWVVELLGGVFERTYSVHDASVNYYDKIQVTSTVLHRLKKASSGAVSTYVDYLHRDHIGSVDVISSSSANLEHNLSFDPFGARRQSDWSKDITQAALDAILNDYDEKTSRGFTDHEMLDRTGIVHMNGRIYDSRIGRFLQPDPIVVAPFFSQDHNRYAYVWNNPLTITDPSGLMEDGFTFVDRSDYSGGRGGREGGGGCQGACIITELYYGPDPVKMIQDRYRYGVNVYAPEASAGLAAGSEHFVSTSLSMSLQASGPDPELVFNSRLDHLLTELIRIGYTIGEETFKILVVDSDDPLFGSMTLEVATAIFPPAKAARLRKFKKIFDKVESTKALPAPTGILSKPVVSNGKLRNTINALFQDTDKILGGTAGAVRHELRTGALVSGTSHVGKAQERIANLRNILRNQELSPADRATANRVLDDLTDALSTPREFR